MYPKMAKQLAKQNWVRVTFLVEKLGWRRPGTIYQDHDS
jgi:hypothetical protein